MQALSILVKKSVARAKKALHAISRSEMRGVVSGIEQAIFATTLRVALLADPGFAMAIEDHDLSDGLMLCFESQVSDSVL